MLIEHFMNTYAYLISLCEMEFEQTGAKEKKAHTQNCLV